MALYKDLDNVRITINGHGAYLQNMHKDLKTTD